MYWSIRDNITHKFQCPLCEFEHDKSAEVKLHLRSHSCRELLLMGFARYMLDSSILRLLATEEANRSAMCGLDSMEDSFKYPIDHRRRDLELISQTDRISDDAGEMITKPSKRSYLEQILSEATFVWESYHEDHKAKIVEFITQPLMCLQMLQRVIQNVLLHSVESRTYCLQGVYDQSQDAALLKLSLNQLRDLAQRNTNVLSVTSLVYVVFIVSHTQKINAQQYTHYWLLRYNLMEETLECWDSYAEFSKQQPHHQYLDDFVRLVFDSPVSNKIQHRITQTYTKGSDCLWNLMKDLICLTGFRNTRTLRRGGETGFNARIMALAPDNDFGRSRLDRIAHLVFELVVQLNKKMIRRIYGKESTMRVQVYSFAKDLIRAAGGTDKKIPHQVDVLERHEVQNIARLAFDNKITSGLYPTPDQLPFILLSERRDFRNLDPSKAASHRSGPVFIADTVEQQVTGLTELIEYANSKPDKFTKTLQEC